MGSFMRILLIDDERDVTDFLQTQLKTESFVVDVATDGERGSSLGKMNDYDLIVLDNLLPKKSGLEVLCDIRGYGKRTPILVLSVTEDTITKVAFLNAGADDYVVKPCSFVELLARIRALLRRPSVIESDILIVGNLVVDVKKHLVKRGETEIYLTQKEFILLEYLLKNKGSVVSRTALLDHGWDMNADPFSNIIEAHILNLRKKVDRIGEKKLIETISGIGYRIS